MTKERRLAIEMWEYIVSNLRQGYLCDGEEIEEFKKDFCKARGAYLV